MCCTGCYLHRSTLHIQLSFLAPSSRLVTTAATLGAERNERSQSGLPGISPTPVLRAEELPRRGTGVHPNPIIIIMVLPTT